MPARLVFPVARSRARVPVRRRIRISSPGRFRPPRVACAVTAIPLAEKAAETITAVLPGSRNALSSTTASSALRAPRTAATTAGSSAGMSPPADSGTPTRRSGSRSTARRKRSASRRQSGASARVVSSTSGASAVRGRRAEVKSRTRSLAASRGSSAARIREPVRNLARASGFPAVDASHVMRGSPSILVAPVAWRLTAPGVLRRISSRRASSASRGRSPTDSTSCSRRRRSGRQAHMASGSPVGESADGTTTSSVAASQSWFETKTAANSSPRRSVSATRTGRSRGAPERTVQISPGRGCVLGGGGL